MLFFKALLQNCSGKLVKVTPQSSSPQLLPKIISQCTVVKWLSQSYYTSNLSLNRLPKIILQSGSRCFSKLLFEASVQNYSSKLFLFPKITPKIISQSRMPHSKKAPQNSTCGLSRQAQYMRQKVGITSAQFYKNILEKIYINNITDARQIKTIARTGSRRT